MGLTFLTIAIPIFSFAAIQFLCNFISDLMVVLLMSAIVQLGNLRITFKNGFQLNFRITSGIGRGVLILDLSDLIFFL